MGEEGEKEEREIERTMYLQEPLSDLAARVLHLDLLAQRIVVLGSLPGFLTCVKRLWLMSFVAHMCGCAFASDVDLNFQNFYFLIIIEISIVKWKGEIVQLGSFLSCPYHCWRLSIFGNIM